MKIRTHAPPTTDDPCLGVTLGGEFRLVRRLGRGLAGPTYEARAVVTDRPVVVELLHGPVAASPWLRGQFLREASALLAAGVPGLVRYRRVGLFPGGDSGPPAPYLICDQPPGCPLDVLVGRRGLAPMRVLRIFEALLDVLERVHRAGWVHRALRPQCIYVAEGLDGVHITLVDTGLAELIEPEGGKHRVGDPHYLAPETIRGDVASPQADLHAVGALLVYALTGAPPFVGPPEQVVLAQLDRPVRGLPVMVDPTGGLTGVVRRAMGRPGALPFVDAADMRRALLGAVVAPYEAVTPPNGIDVAAISDALAALEPVPGDEWPDVSGETTLVDIELPVFAPQWLSQADGGLIAELRAGTANPTADPSGPGETPGAGEAPPIEPRSAAPSTLRSRLTWLAACAASLSALLILLVT